MKHFHTTHVFAAMLALAALPSASHAQYMWLDEKGMKHLSDQPPPPSVPQNRILKQPRGQGQLQPAAPTAAANGDAAPETPEAKVKRPATLAERNADFAKRKTEAQAAEQKAAEESARKADAASNCAAARSDKAALDSGTRISQFDAQGQRSFLSDEQRAERARRNQKILADCAR